MHSPQTKEGEDAQSNKVANEKIANAQRSKPRRKYKQ